MLERLDRREDKPCHTCSSLDVLPLLARSDRRGGGSSFWLALELRRLDSEALVPEETRLDWLSRRGLTDGAEV